jgi:hypothetical protein
MPEVQGWFVHEMASNTLSHSTHLAFFDSKKLILVMWNDNCTYREMSDWQPSGCLNGALQSRSFGFELTIS